MGLACFMACLCSFAAPTIMVHNDGTGTAFYYVMWYSGWTGSTCSQGFYYGVVGCGQLAAGATATHNGQCTPGCSTQYALRASGCASGAPPDVDSQTDSSGCSSSTYHLYLSGNRPADVYPAVYCYTNNSPFTVLAVPVVYDSGTNTSCGALDGRKTGYTLLPGQSACYDGGQPCNPWKLYWEIITGSTNTPPTYSPTNIVGTPNSPSTNGTSGGTFKPGLGLGNGPGAPTGSGSGSNTNLTGDQYSKGIGGLITLNFQGFSQLHGDLEHIGQGITNAGAGIGTNGLGWATNTGQWASFGKGTNASLSDGAAALGSADTVAATVVAGVGGTNGPSFGTGSSISLMTIPFVTGDLDLNPEDLFPGIPGIVKQLVGWSATLAFLFWCGKRYNELTGVFATAQTGGVPDLDVDVPLVGNVAGPITAAIVSLAFIALWVGIFTFLFGAVLNFMGNAYWTTNPFTAFTAHTASGGSLSLGSSHSTGAAATYLLNEFMPVSYCLSLAFTQLTLLFSMPKLVAVSAASSRFLFGK